MAYKIDRDGIFLLSHYSDVLVPKESIVASRYINSSDLIEASKQVPVSIIFPLAGGAHKSDLSACLAAFWKFVGNIKHAHSIPYMNEEEISLGNCYAFYPNSPEDGVIKGWTWLILRNR